MKTPIVKTLAIILLSLSAKKIFAFPAFNPEDTTRKILLPVIDKITDSVVVLKEANVEFPAILSGNETQSLDYIENFFTVRKNYLVRTYQRSKKIFPKVVSILKKYNVPEEFKVLLALESGFNGNAVSPAGAVGYWQIMDGVAREYGLRIASNKKIKRTGKKHHVRSITTDDRKNFSKSTHAAARYLQDRSRNLNNDCLLMVASYNCGVGNVWNAMEKTGMSNPTFWDIKKFLPAETRAYVMNFIALNVLFHNYEKFSKNTLCFKPLTCIEKVPEKEQADDCTSSL
ncbi:MAG: lytic transglycosylase domain-containing protein [Ferruginibacter sp.]